MSKAPIKTTKYSEAYTHRKAHIADNGGAYIVTNAQWDAFRTELVDMVEPCAIGDNGGCRIVIDDRYLNTGVMTVQVLSGENLDRHADQKTPEVKKQRWMQSPSP